MTNQNTRTILRSDEFSCPSCVEKIEKSLKALPGVAKAEVSFASGRIDVDHDPAQTDVQALIASVAAAGYAARPSVI